MDRELDIRYVDREGDKKREENKKMAGDRKNIAQDINTWTQLNLD